MFGADQEILRLRLVATEHAPRQARDAVRVWAVGMSALARADLLLVVSELVSNSVRHGPDGGAIRLDLVAREDGVRVEVRDQGHPKRIAAREPQSAGLFAGGYGLRLVEKLSTSWGSAEAPTRVWASLRASGVRA